MFTTHSAALSVVTPDAPFAFQSQISNHVGSAADAVRAAIADLTTLAEHLDRAADPKGADALTPEERAEALSRALLYVDSAGASGPAASKVDKTLAHLAQALGMVRAAQALTGSNA